MKKGIDIKRFKELVCPKNPWIFNGAVGDELAAATGISPIKLILNQAQNNIIAKEYRILASDGKAKELRMKCRQGVYTDHTSGTCPDHIQANLVVLPNNQDAKDFLAFSMLNSVSCPLLGVYQSPVIYPDISDKSNFIDISSDLPRYKIWKHDEKGGSRLISKDATSRREIKQFWENELGYDAWVFLLGCSFTAESFLAKFGLTPPNVKHGLNVSMYNTSINNLVCGKFGGNLVVSMRMYKKDEIEKVKAITSQIPEAHGAPIHCGDPAEIGIDDIRKPDFGDALPDFYFNNKEYIPCFWACGVTPQAAILNSGINCALTHAPGCMLVTDSLITFDKSHNGDHIRKR